MSLFSSIRQMTEEDVKLRFITPAITAKWPVSNITMETKITDGRINLRGNKVSRDKAKKVDYLLYLSSNNPSNIYYMLTYAFQVLHQSKGSGRYQTTIL